MREIQSKVMDIQKVFEVEDVDDNYFIKACELLEVEYPSKEYHYTRFFQRRKGKVFMYIRIEFKNA